MSPLEQMKQVHKAFKALANAVLLALPESSPLRQNTEKMVRQMQEDGSLTDCVPTASMVKQGFWLCAEKGYPLGMNGITVFKKFQIMSTEAEAAHWLKDHLRSSHIARSDLLVQRYAYINGRYRVVEGPEL